MRIWYQSSLTLDSESEGNPYRQSLVKHAKEIARHDTQIDIKGLEFSDPQHATSSYGRYLHKNQVINNAIRAEEEGYDAFCVGCTMDPGFPEIKEIVEIPVLFLFESCLHLACILGGRFSLISFNKDALLYSIQQIKQYGLYELFVPCEAYSGESVDLANGFENPQPIVEGAKKVTKKIADGGVGILLPACNILNQILTENNTTQLNGIPILDTVGSLIKITELMVDLKRVGINKSNAGLFATLSKEKLMHIRKAYGIE